MWTQNYEPVAGSLALSALAAVVPLLVLGYALGVQRAASWRAALYALIAAVVVACGVYRMPAALATITMLYGAVFGLWALGWMVFAAILLFDVVMALGRFDDIRASLAAISTDARIQALLIAFAFGAFIEGAAGAGTPVAVSATLLVALGFPGLLAGGICLLANTAPVAFGALGLPIVTLTAVTDLPLMPISAAVGRIAPIVAIIIPAFLVVVLAGRKGALKVWPAIVVCGGTFAFSQFWISNYMGPQLADILGALATIVAMVALLRVWRPSSEMRFETDHRGQETLTHGVGGNVGVLHRVDRVAALKAWAPYLLLVVFIVLWGTATMQRYLDRPTVRFQIPGLHNMIERIAPVVARSAPYPATFTFNSLGANGTACFLAAVLSGLLGGLGPRRLTSITLGTARRLLPAELTFMLLMALAYVMNYAGVTATLGLALAASGHVFPFFSAYLGWLGVFLTGSDTSSNALFGNLQVVSARALGLNPVLMAAVNTTGGVMGKMISVASIAVAAAATGLPSSDEGKLFRFTLWYSVILAGVIGVIAMLYAYVVPGWMPQV